MLGKSVAAEYMLNVCQTMYIISKKYVQIHVEYIYILNVHRIYVKYTDVYWVLHGAFCKRKWSTGVGEQ